MTDLTKMNPEVKAKWMEALDTYPQSRGNLKNAAGFCCLGVLTDLYMKEHPELTWDPVGESHIFSISGAVHSVLPNVVTRWAGIAPGCFNPVVEYKGANYTLAELNDGLKVPFSELKKIIEEQL